MKVLKIIGLYILAFPIGLLTRNLRIVRNNGHFFKTQHLQIHHYLKDGIIINTTKIWEDFPIINEAKSMWNK